MALDFDSWIKFAEINDLLITKQDFKKLKKAHPYDAIQIDYIRFLAIEWADRYQIKLNHVYKPVYLYQQFKETLIPIDLTPKHQDAILVPFSTNDFYEISFETTGRKNWLATGNGDGFSRWMLWSNLFKMPNVYIDIKLLI